MDNKKLFLTLQGIICKITDEDVKKFLEFLYDNRITVSKPPAIGLLMMAATDPFETDFYVGEILVTEAEVKYKGIIGYGMVMGHDPERALLASILDAKLRSQDFDSINQIKDLIIQKENEISQSEELERRLVAKTKVSFEMMAKR